MAKLTVTQGQTCAEILFEGRPVLGMLLARHGFGQQQPCGGRGECGKCAVAAQGAISAPTEAEKRFGSRLACQIKLLGDCEVVLAPQQDALQIQVDGAAHTAAKGAAGTGVYGAAVDIGTTTVALRLYDRQTGVCLATQAALNPQTQAAADVIGRISAAMSGGGALLKQMITDCVERLLAAACREAGIIPERVDTVVATGNTTMLYLLEGRDPAALSHAPFRADTLFGCRSGLFQRNTYLPPCMDAFVGADITCAVLASGMCAQHRTALLMDVGTNGEIALWYRGKLHVASTAAGPAFEGVGISQGCASVSGAIDRVWVENGAFRLHTIDGAPARGICGSGLIDAIAAMLALERIDETGAMEAQAVSLTDAVAVTAKDVRSVQLAKGAIAAGVNTLLRTVGIAADGVDVLYIAGGFGSHLDVESAARIGLIPHELTARVKVLGNAALAGASMLLLNPDNLALAKQIAELAQPVALGGNPLFNELYMEAMLFDA